jgi:hypothetical protein
MKGLSIVFTVSLFVFAGILSQILKRSGLLPSQLSSQEKPAAIRSMPLGFANYGETNPNHLN